MVDRDAGRQRGAAYGSYVRVRSRDGAVRWARARGRVQRDAEGRPHRVVRVVRDVTDELSHRAEPSAGGRERCLVAVVESTTEALARARTVREVIDVLDSPAGLRRFGLVDALMGLVEGGRIQPVAEGRVGGYLSGTASARVEDGLPMSEVVRTGEPRFVSREEFAVRYPRLWPHVRPLDVNSAAYLPLVAEGRTIGVLGLFFRQTSPFTPADRALLDTLGGGIAQSLQRAVLHDQEQDLAESLQQAMLPRTIPRVAGAEVAVRYRSAHLGRDIGGDWYDVVPLAGDRVAVVVGDVQGHDTDAAALMGQLRIVLRAYAAEGHPPAAVVARGSSFLHELAAARFATCAYVEVDLASGGLRIVRAGHPEPLVRRADGAGRWLRSAGGLPLGLSAEFGQSEYPETAARLSPGDALVLYTDGLVEWPGADIGRGMRRLADEVRRGPRDIHRLADRLCAAAEERGGQDDMALLVLRRRTAADPTDAPSGRDGGRGGHVTVGQVGEGGRPVGGGRR